MSLVSPNLIFIENSCPKKLETLFVLGVDMKKNQDNLITHADFLAVSRRVHYNEHISEFYERMDKENGTYRVNTIKVLRDCCKYWDFDYYNVAGVKNLIRMNRCRDRFCLNCQSLSADRRLAQYSPILDGYVKDYDVYHVVLTVPNVDSEYLHRTIRLMLDRFSYFMRYFSGSKRIRGVNFSCYGYVGAVRALEITYNVSSKTYHPHLHCIFVLKKNMRLPQVYWNRFSDDRTGRRPPRFYTEFELLIQRVWALLILRIPVTKFNIENISQICPYPDGFSCIADLSNGKYSEVFKYAIKGSYKCESILEYEVFKTMYKALWNVKVYQSYGVLRKYDFNVVGDDLGLLDTDELYELFINQLQAQELPRRITEELDYILSETRDESATSQYISKSTFIKHLRTLSGEGFNDFVSALYGEKKE